MWAINICTLSYLLLLVSTIPGPTAVLVLSTALEIQSNQSLPLETPSPANALFAPPFPPKPPIPPQPPLPPSPPIRRLKCFPPTEKGVMTPNVQDCEAAIEYILHIYPPGPLVPLNFTRSGGGNYRFPEAWMVKNCQIMITSLDREPDVWDMIRFVDIVAGAQEVLKVCVPQSKFGFAGYAVIGDKGSYVTVNGWKTDGNGMNATSAVENPLLTGVSGLALEDGLDEDGKLNVT